MILCLRILTRSSSGRLLNVLSEQEDVYISRFLFRQVCRTEGVGGMLYFYLRYHLRQARTEAFVQTHDETVTPAPKTAIK